MEQLSAVSRDGLHALQFAVAVMDRQQQVIALGPAVVRGHALSDEIGMQVAGRAGCVPPGGSLGDGMGAGLCLCRLPLAHDGVARLAVLRRQLDRLTSG